MNVYDIVFSMTRLCNSGGRVIYVRLFHALVLARVLVPGSVVIFSTGNYGRKINRVLYSSVMRFYNG